MSSGFVFPPPPPPPPPKSSDRGSSSRPSAASGRGRGQWTARGGGRGVGAHHRQGSSSRRSADWDRPQSTGLGRPARPYFYQSPQPSTGRGQKRTHNEAFEHSRKPVPGGLAPPAVPSFGLDLNLSSVVLLTHVSREIPKSKKERLFNQLGLTPRKEEHESSEEEDDADEESRHAALLNGPGDHGLQFEHNGRVTSLNSPAEIQAWIAERKKRYPTKSRIAEAVAIRAEAQKTVEVGRKNARQKQRTKDSPPSVTHRPTKDLKNDTRFQAPQSLQLPPVIAESTGVKPSNIEYSNSVRKGDSSSEDSVETSSEGSSDDESLSSGVSTAGGESSDSAPEEGSSKIPVTELEPPALPSGETLKQKRACRHDVLSDTSWKGAKERNAPRPKTTRLSLHEQLLVQQHDQENREILRLITILGNKGFLD